MTWRVRILLILVFFAACDRGPDKPPGLAGAGPLVAEFERVAKGLDDIAPVVATWNGKGELPDALVADMTEVGKAARAVLDAAEPDGDAGAAALRAAAVDAADDVVHHLITVAGGHELGPGRMALNPGPVAFDTDDRNWPPGPTPLRARNRTEAKFAAQEVLEDALRGEIERFVYVALLAHPGTRATLAPRLSADNLPTEVPPDGRFSVFTLERWRMDLFDDQNRLIVPNPADQLTYENFTGLVKVVSPDLGVAVSSLMSPVFQLLKNP